MLQRTTRKPVGADAVATDIDELQRQYRLMELTRKAQSDDKATNVRMQRAAMEKLRRDNERLKEDLALETRQARHANNQSASAQIAKLQDQGDMYARKIEVERRRCDELDKQIARVEKHILESRKEMGGVNASRDTNTSVTKQIRILENRLDKALVKFNEALAHNKSLRETIDNLRRERVVFDGIYKKLEEELHAKKNTMATILQDSDAAYRARDQAHAEMLALKAAADAQQQNFEQEWSQLGQLIEKDRKLKEFIKTQQRERSLRLGGSMGGGGSSGAGGSGGMGGGSDPGQEEEQKLRKKVSKGAHNIAKDKANISLSMEKVQSYEEAFAKIQKATKITDIDELVATFVSAEDQNFSLFNYVNDLSHEIEKVEENIAEIKAEIAKFQSANPTSADGAGAGAAANSDPQVGALGRREGDAAGGHGGAPAGGTVLLNAEGKPMLDAEGRPLIDAGPIGPNDSQRKKMMLELEGKLTRTEAQAAAYDDKYQGALRTVSVLKSGIQNLFFKIGCQNLAASEMLGSAGVTESNMMQYLGIIEERTNQLVAELGGTIEENSALAQALRSGEDDDEQQQQQLQLQQRVGSGSMDDSATGGPVSIQAPSVDEDADEEEEEEDGEEDEDAAARRRHAASAAAGGDEDEEDYGDEQPMSEQELRGGGD